MLFTTFLMIWLGGTGITHIIVDGRIMNSFRKWVAGLPSITLFGWTFELKEIVECHQCCGMWVGMVLTLLHLYFNPIYIACAGGAVSLTSMLARSLLDYLESNTNFTWAPPNETPESH